MKTKCTEETSHGDDVSVHYNLPDQEQEEAGQKPYFTVDCLDLLVREESGTIDRTAGMFMVDSLELFMEAARDKERADIVAEWLEFAAKAVRKKFD